MPICSVELRDMTSVHNQFTQTYYCNIHDKRELSRTNFIGGRSAPISSERGNSFSNFFGWEEFRLNDSNPVLLREIRMDPKCYMASMN